MTTAQKPDDAFQAHLHAMPEWLPEFEVHRPWVEALLRDAWRAATERAAVLCEDTDVVEVRGSNSYYCQLGDAAATRAACAAAIRGTGGVA